MPIRPDKRNIPTVAQSVELYIESQRAERKKDIRNLISVLKGPEKRVDGKKAAGPALAKSELGQVPCYRITDTDMRRWFSVRHPEHLADATVKRGMSAVRGYLKSCIRKGWMDESVLEACFSAPDSNPRREWLHAENSTPSPHWSRRRASSMSTNASRSRSCATWVQEQRRRLRSLPMFSTRA